MSDFLGRLLTRSLPEMPAGGAATADAAPVALVRPRLASRFEPVSPALAPLVEERREGEDLERESYVVRPQRGAGDGGNARFEADTVGGAHGPLGMAGEAKGPSPLGGGGWERGEDRRGAAASAKTPSPEPGPAPLLSSPRLQPAPSQGGGTLRHGDEGGGALSRAAGEGRGGGSPAENGRGVAPSPTLPRADARERAPSALPQAAAPEPGKARDAVTPRLDLPKGGGALSRAAGEGRGGGTLAPPERLRIETVVRHETAPPPSDPPPPVLQPKVAAVEREPFPTRREERAAEPVIHVTIGRIEVKATPAPKVPARERSAARPATGLEEYLRQRAKGEAR